MFTENKNLLIILSISLYLLSNLQMTYQMANFSFNLEKREKFCMHEYYPDQTLITYIISTTSQEALNIVVRDANHNKLTEKKSVSSFKDSFTTFEGGVVEICIINVINDQVSLDYEHKSGIAAKDYSQVPKLKDLAPIEQDLVKLEDFSKELYHLIMYADQHDKAYSGLQGGILMGISWVSFFIIILMLVVGGIEAFVGQKIVMNRKMR